MTAKFCLGLLPSLQKVYVRYSVKSLLRGTRPPSSKDGSSSRAGEETTSTELSLILPSPLLHAFFGLLPTLPRLARPTVLGLEIDFLTFSFPDVLAICATLTELQSKLLVHVNEMPHF